MVVLKKPGMNGMREIWKCVDAVTHVPRVDMFTSQSDPPSSHVWGVDQAAAHHGASAARA